MPRRVVAVGAGKGGVGKSTIALNLASALRAHGSVGLLDLDFYGPNIPAMVGIDHERWTQNWTLASTQGRRFTPVVRQGLFIASTGFILGEDQPLGVDAKTATLIAAQFVHAVRWPELGFLVVDLPPGTTAIQNLLVKELHCDGAIVVVTPDLVAHLDGRKAVQMFRSLKVRVLGAVENMAGGTCPRCGEEIELFSTTPHDRTIWAMGVDRLARIPLQFHKHEREPTSPTILLFAEREELATEVIRRLAG